MINVPPGVDAALHPREDLHPTNGHTETYVGQEKECETTRPEEMCKCGRFYYVWK